MPKWFPKDVWRADWNPAVVNGNNVLMSSDVRAGAIALWAAAAAAAVATVDGGSADDAHACCDDPIDGGASQLSIGGDAVWDRAIVVAGGYFDSARGGVDFVVSPMVGRVFTGDDAAAIEAVIMASKDDLLSAERTGVRKWHSDGYEYFVNTTYTGAGGEWSVNIGDFSFDAFFAPIWHTQPCRHKDERFPSPANEPRAWV